MPIKVVLAEDSYLVREGVRRLLEHEPDIDLVGVCEDYDSLLEAIAGTEPDVLLTDIRMPPTGTDEGVRAAERLRQLRPEAGVVLLSQYADPAYALAFLEGGTEGRAYLLKERVADLDQLLAAIREVARGGSVIDPKVVEALVAARSRNARSPLARLTPREREVLALLAEGRSNAAVADGLVLSERAVEKHINSIFAKLGLPEARDAHRRVKAVLLFLADQR
ncbi:MAG TPA: response regulator transcription factor [Actinomycetota bacterium]|nr:response regulator transcription factor [Actinomycetota bacterium]